MTDEAKKARAAYLREWRKKNPDKVKKQAENYWERQAKKAQEEKTEAGKV